MTKPESDGSPSREQQSREIFRTRTPVVVWWVWLAFAVINAIDLAIQWHHRSALVYGAILALGTGVAYACALRPRMIADDTGIAIHNPLRDCTVPWGAVRAVDVGEAVQVHYSLPDGTKKVFPSWAMFASSRSQLRADMRARRTAAQLSKTSKQYTRLPSEAKDAMARTETQLVAMMLDERAEQVRARTATPGQPTSGPSTTEQPRLAWAWASIAAIAMPAIALVTLLLT
jgi:hypothetical protein